MLSRVRRRRDPGFTLIELLLTVTLLGVIGAAIVGAFLVMLTTKESTSEQLDASADQQFLANFFTDDVAGANLVFTGTQTVCGAAVSAVVVFQGTDFTPGTTTAVTTRTAWVYRSAERRIERIRCVGTVQTQRVLARDVPTPPALSASCDSNVAMTSGANPAPVQVALSVPSTFGTTADLCGRRRAA